MNDDIVITGLGMITNLGATGAETWQGILSGRTALGPMSELEQRPVPDKGGGQAVPLPPDGRETWSRERRYLRAAAEQAIGGAGGLHASPSRRAAILGTTLHGMRSGGRYLRSDAAEELSSFLAGAVLDGAFEGLDISGLTTTTCSACSSGLASIALGVTVLRSGDADVVLVGGYDPVSEYAYAGFDSLRLVAAAAPLPFAADRDGMKLAEGYCVLVLERAADAARRGARTLARIAGCGESADAFHLTQPRPDGAGAARAITDALAQAGAQPSDVDMVCAHGTATQNNDAAEYAALASVFGEAMKDLPITALKSHLGHTLGGAGAVELGLCLLAREHSLVPPVAHQSIPDPAFTNLRLVQHMPLPRALRTTASLSLGFGGANTCVVLRDPRPATVPPFSAAPARSPVISGVGAILPGAIGNDAFLQCISRPAAPPTADSGIIPEDAIAAYINARRTRRMSEYAKLTLAATTQACRHAGVDADRAFLTSSCALLASMHGSSPFCNTYYSQIVREGISAANPVLFAEGVPNAGAAQLSLMLGLQGACQTLIGSRRSLVDALGLAAMRIRDGSWNHAIVGAAEEYSDAVNKGYKACGLYTGGAPGGFCTGAGAVSFVLETEESAIARGVRPLVRLGHLVSDSSARPPHSRTDASPPAGVVGAWSPIRHETLALRGLAASSLVWNAGDWFPELFSVGPAIALAALALDATPIKTLASLVAADFTRGISRLSVEPVRSATPEPATMPSSIRSLTDPGLN